MSAAPTAQPAAPHGIQRRGPAICGQREATSSTSAAVTTASGISQESHSPSPTPETGGVMPCASSRAIHGAASTQTAPSDHATTGAWGRVRNATMPAIAIAPVRNKAPADALSGSSAAT